MTTKKRYCNYTKKGKVIFIYVKKPGVYCNVINNVEKVNRKHYGFTYFDTKEDFKVIMDRFKQAKKN